MTENDTEKTPGVAMPGRPRLVRCAGADCGGDMFWTDTAERYCPKCAADQPPPAWAVTPKDHAASLRATVELREGVTKMFERSAAKQGKWEAGMKTKEQSGPGMPTGEYRIHNAGWKCGDPTCHCAEPNRHSKEQAEQAIADLGLTEFAESVRCFSTGATRDTDTGKLDYEGFDSPLVVRRYAQFMHRHRVQSDGTLRDSDNWQKGIPRDQYAKSLIRHVVEFWLAHRGFEVQPASERDPQDVEDVLCAILFNAKGYLFELLKAKEEPHDHQA